jgi:hypothetical protein
MVGLALAGVVVTGCLGSSHSTAPGSAGTFSGWTRPEVTGQVADVQTFGGYTHQSAVAYVNCIAGRVDYETWSKIPEKSLSEPTPAADDRAIKVCQRKTKLVWAFNHHCASHFQSSASFIHPSRSTPAAIRRMGGSEWVCEAYIYIPDQQPQHLWLTHAEPTQLSQIPVDPNPPPANATLNANGSLIPTTG